MLMFLRIQEHNTRQKLVRVVVVVVVVAVAAILCCYCKVDVEINASQWF